MNATEQFAALRNGHEAMQRTIRQLDAENLAMRRALERIDANASQCDPGPSAGSHFEKGCYFQAKIAREAMLSLGEPRRLTRFAAENVTMERSTDAMLGALAHYFLNSYDGPDSNVPEWVHEMEESLADLLVGDKGAFLRSERIRKLVKEEMDRQSSVKHGTLEALPLGLAS